MRSRTLTWLGVAAAGLAAALHAPPAKAQTAQEKAAAEALFDEAKKLVLDKKFAEACPKFERSLKLEPGIGTRLFLADCYETTGRFASAWAMFREAAAAAHAAGQGEREGVARARAAALEPKLFRLTLNVASPPAGLKIVRNDEEQQAASWNVALPVDAGKYTVTATAPGKKPWSGTVEIPAGPGDKSLAIPALEDDPSARAVETPKGPPGGGGAPQPEPGLGGQRIAGIGIGAVGLLSLGASGLFTGMAASRNSTAKSLCPKPSCANPDGVTAGKNAGTLADAATGTLVAGGVLAAGGLVIILTAPKRAAAPSG
jgi:hypothetical protein